MTPRLAAVAVVVHAYGPVGAPADGQAAISRYLDNCRPPADCRAIRRQERTPGLGDFLVPAGDFTRHEAGIRIDETQESGAIPGFGRAAESGLGTYDLLAQGRVGHCNGRKYDEHLIEHVISPAGESWATVAPCP